ncbi:Gfo/Idh/MocA family protein [Candidatus Poribacteria bacterium]
MANTGPIKLGMVGIGRAGGGMHCRELESRKEMFQIVAACDIMEERRDQMAERYGCKVYEDIADLIADPDVEMVDIATRSCDHFEHVKMALEAGKEVNIEKPMSCTYAEATGMRDIASKSIGNLYVRHNRRFEPGFQHIREIIASGILGDVYEIKLRRVSYSRRDDWQTIKEFGGGQLLNWGPHIIDHGLQFLGAPESPLKSIRSDLKLVAAVGDAEDHLKIILTGANDCIVDLEISGGAAISQPEYMIWGTKGALVCKKNTITLKYLDPKVELPPREPNPGTPGKGFGSPESLPWVEESIEVNPAKKVDMTMIWDELYKAVREGADFPVTLDQSVEVMRVVSAAKEGTKFA